MSRWETAQEQPGLPFSSEQSPYRWGTGFGQISQAQPLEDQEGPSPTPNILLPTQFKPPFSFAWMYRLSPYTIRDLQSLLALTTKGTSQKVCFPQGRGQWLSR